MAVLTCTVAVEAPPKVGMKANSPVSCSLLYEALVHEGPPGDIVQITTLECQQAGVRSGITWKTIRSAPGGSPQYSVLRTTTAR